MAIIVRRNITPNNFIQFRQTGTLVQYTLDGLMWRDAFVLPDGICEPEVIEIGNGGTTIEYNVGDIYDIVNQNTVYAPTTIYNNVWQGENGTAQNTADAQGARLCNALYTHVHIFNEILKKITSDGMTALNAIVGGLADTLATELLDSAVPFVAQGAYIFDNLISRPIFDKWKKDTFNRSDFNPSLFNLTPLTGEEVLTIVCDAKEEIDSSSFTYDEVKDAITNQMDGGYITAFNNYFNSNTFASLVANLWGMREENACVCEDCKVYDNVGMFAFSNHVIMSENKNTSIFPVWQGDASGLSANNYLNMAWAYTAKNGELIKRIGMKFDFPTGVKARIFELEAELSINLAGSETTFPLPDNQPFKDQWFYADIPAHTDRNPDVAFGVVNMAQYNIDTNTQAKASIEGARITAIKICTGVY